MDQAQLLQSLRESGAVNGMMANSQMNSLRAPVQQMYKPQVNPILQRVLQLFGMGGQGGGKPPKSAIDESRRNAVQGIVKQGITDPNEILKLLSESSKASGYSSSDFTPEEVRAYMRPNSYIGTYNQDGVRSIGGHIGPVGATIGMQGATPFGSFNVNGQTGGSFGSQDPNDPKNPIVNRILATINPLRSAMNSAQDIGTGIRAGQSQKDDLAQKELLAKSLEADGNLEAANMVRQQISGEAGDISRSFSPDVSQNPIKRGIEGGAEIVSTAAIISGLLSLLKGAPQAAAQAASQPQSFEQSIAHDARMNKISETIVPDNAVSNYSSRFGNVTPDFNINDPKQLFLRNLANKVLNNNITTGRIR